MGLLEAFEKDMKEPMPTEPDGLRQRPKPTSSSAPVILTWDQKESAGLTDSDWQMLVDAGLAEPPPERGLVSTLKRTAQLIKNDGVVPTKQPEQPAQPVQPPAVPATGSVATPISDNPYMGIVNQAAQKYNVDPQLITEVMRQESAFDPNAVSRAGAQGIMQLMPGTARELGVTDPFDPEQNIMAGTRYLAKNIERFGDVNKALAAYNWGPTNVANKGTDNLPKETRDYVDKITSKYKAQPNPQQMPGPLPDVAIKKIASTLDVPEERVTAEGGIWSELMKNPDAFRRSYAIANKGLERSNLGYKMLMGTATEEDRAQVRKLGFMIEQEAKLTTEDPIVGKSVGTVLPSLVNSMANAGKGALLGGSVGAVAGAPAGGIGAAPGAAIGASAGALMYPLNKAREMEAGGAYLDFKDRGIDDDIAKIAAHSYGLGSMLLESAAFKMLKHIIPGGNKLGGTVFKSAIDNVIAKMSNPTSRAFGRLGLAAGGESSVEATQQFLGNLIEEIAATASDKFKGTNVSTEDAAKYIYNLQKGVAETFATTLIGMGVLGVPGTSINILTDTKAGREAVADAVKEDPTSPPEETIKKKAAKKQEAQAKKNAMQKAAEEHEVKKEEAKKKAEAKKKKDEPAPIKPIVPDPNADAPGPPGSSISYPDRPKTAPVQPVAVEPKPIAPLMAETPAPTEAPVSRFGETTEPQTGTAAPIRDLFGTTQTVNPQTGQTETKADPKLGEVLDRFGKGNRDPNNPYIQMIAREEMKGVTQNKLTQPAIMLQDGTIVNGDPLSGPWMVSDFSKDTPKANAIAEEMGNSFSNAKSQAANQGKDINHAKAGFIVGGKFVPSSLIVGKFKIGQHIAEQKKEIVTKRDAATQKEIDSLNKARDAWAAKVKTLREPSDVDIQAAETLIKAADQAAKNLVNTKLGKHFDITDLKSAAREAMYMVMLGTDPQRISDFVTEKELGYFKFIVGAVSNHLKNYQKEQLGPRRQVVNQLNKGTLRTPLPLNEAVVGEVVERAVPQYTTEEQVTVPIGRTVQQSSGFKAASSAVGVKLTDTMPSIIKRIDPKTGLIIEEVSLGTQAGRLAARRQEIAKEKAAKKAAAIARREEAAKAEAAKPEKPQAKKVETPKKVAPTPTEKLAKVKQAKPAKKASKPSSAASQLRAKATTENISIDTMLEIRKQLLNTPGAISATKEGASFRGVKGADLRAATLNAKDGKGTWEVIADPDSVGNWLVVKSDVLASLYDTAGDVTDTAAPSPLLPQSPIKDTANFSGGNVPTEGTIFDQIKKHQTKVLNEVEKAADARDTKTAKAVEKAEKKIVDLFSEPVKEAGTESAFSDITKNAQSKKNKDIIDIFAPTKNDVGSAAVLNKAAEFLYEYYNAIVNKLDVEHKWKQFHASKIGLAIKVMYGKVDGIERREGKKLVDLAKLAKRQDRKITTEQMTDCVLAAEDSKLMKKLPDAHKPIAQWIRQYFDDSLQEYADRNIDISFSRRKMAELIEEILDGKDWDARLQAIRDAVRLQQVEFVHIPLNVLRANLKNAKKDTAFKRQFEKKIRSLEMLAAKKRRALSLADMVNKGLIKKIDIDAFTLLANYMRNKANDMAVADIRDAAMESGLMKVRESKPKADKNGSWRVVPPRFRGLSFYDQSKGKVWIHESIISALEDSQEAIVKRGKWSKLMSWTKMAQFYNPIFLPAYDLVQFAMLTATDVTGYHKIPGATLKAIRDVWTQSEDYLVALENGLASTPFATSFDEYMAKARSHSNNLNSTMGRVGQFLAEWGVRRMLPKKDGKWRIPVITAAYEASWHVAWRLDNVVRMMSYNYLRKQGHSELSAAQTAAKFHGDYASVPMKTRQTLNQVIFTPTFAIAMTKLAGEMVTQFVKTGAGFRRKGTTKAQRRMAYGAISTAAILFGTEAIMHAMGFETDEWGRRYSKRMITSKGERSEVAVTIATPANVVFRLSSIVAAGFRPGSSNSLLAMAKKARWKLHPMWRVMIDLVFNMRSNGDPIYGTFDDWDEKLAKTVQYATQSLLSITQLAPSDGVGVDKEAKRYLTKETGELLGWLIPKFAFVYVTKPEDYQKAMKIRQMGRAFRKEAKSLAKKDKSIPMKTWLRNYKKRVKAILED